MSYMLARASTRWAVRFILAYFNGGISLGIIIGGAAVIMLAGLLPNSTWLTIAVAIGAVIALGYAVFAHFEIRAVKRGLEALEGNPEPENPVCAFCDHKPIAVCSKCGIYACGSHLTDHT